MRASTRLYDFTSPHYILTWLLPLSLADGTVNEHVVFADCVNSGNIHLSHMAYYSNGLAKLPDSVTVVSTPYNTTAIWTRRSNNATSATTQSAPPLNATFPDGVVFSANLTTTRDDGDFAGLGSNGYTDFNCWTYNVPNLYSWYSTVTCDAVYDCNHQPQAGDSSTANSTTSSTPPSTTNSGSSGGSGGNGKKSDDIALGVGLGIGIPSLIATLVGIWVALRKPAWIKGLGEHLYMRSHAEEGQGEDPVIEGGDEKVA